MNNADAQDRPVPIDISATSPFRLGRIDVVPAELLLRGADWTHRLEPRAMQVLVALSEGAPGVVSRHDLNHRVWGGRIVGDDAVNRAVQLLRRAASNAPGAAPFTIETIPKVGYKLRVAEVADASADQAAGSGVPAEDGAEPGPDHKRKPTRRRMVIVLTLVLIVLLAGAVAVSLYRDRQARASAGSVTELDGLPPSAVEVVFSPDGQSMVYRAQDGANGNRLFLLQGGAADVALTPRGMNPRKPAWRGDGERLAFVDYDPGTPCKVMVMKPGDMPGQVGGCDNSREPSLAWSTDGKRILFADAPGENAVQPSLP